MHLTQLHRLHRYPLSHRVYPRECAHSLTPEILTCLPLGHAPCWSLPAAMPISHLPESSLVSSAGSTSWHGLCLSTLNRFSTGAESLHMALPSIFQLATSWASFHIRYLLRPSYIRLSYEANTRTDIRCHQRPQSDLMILSSPLMALFFVSSHIPNSSTPSGASKFRSVSEPPASFLASYGEVSSPSLLPSSWSVHMGRTEEMIRPAGLGSMCESRWRCAYFPLILMDP